MHKILSTFSKEIGISGLLQKILAISSGKIIFAARFAPTAVFFLALLCSCKMQPSIYEKPTEYENAYQSGSDSHDSTENSVDLSYEISSRLVHLSDFYPQEKLYIHTDKSHYLPGETIWFKLYLTDASSHEASSLSRLVYVEFADTSGMLAGRRYIEITDGTGHGDLVLETDIEPGLWILRGHTNYMRNYSNNPLFSMELRVINAYSARTGITGSSKQSAEPGKGSQVSDSPADRPDALHEPSATTEAKVSEVSATRGDSNPVAKENPETASVLSSTPANDLNIRFFPEGGDLVAGIGSVVVVKAAGTGGAGVKVRENIFDDLGNNVAGFATGKFGLGRFEFTPLAGRRYHAEVETAGTTIRFDLPGVRETGYTLQVNNSMPDGALVRIETNITHGLSNAFLVGHIRGQIFCLEKLPEGNIAIINVNKKEFPAGIVHFTLFSAEGMPVAERLVFIKDNEPRARLEVVKSAEVYNHREKAELEFELTDGSGNPLKGYLSVSVTDSYVVPSHHDRHNIGTYLLLTSDLPGTIENPGYFFDPGNADRHLLLDLVMTTNGWRRFRWDDLIAGRYPVINYPAGSGHLIDGTVSLINQHDIPVAAQVMLSSLGDGFFASSQVTGADGRFQFDDIHLYDTTILVLQGTIYNERRAQRRERRGWDDTFTPGSDHLVNLKLDEPEIAPGVVDIAAATVAEEVMKAYIEDSMKDPLLSHLEDIWQLEIEEVEIRRRRPEVRTTFDRAIHGTPFRPMDRIIPDEYPFTYTYHNLWEFIRARRPALIIDQGEPRFLSGPTSYSISAQMGTKIILDGIHVKNKRDIETLPIETISFIDLIRLPQAAMYGMGYDLVIAIFTKTTEDYRDADTGTSGLLSFKFPGYYRAREFYSPVYDNPGPHDNQPDYRTTLFWDPEIKTGEDGRAKVSFFTSDKASVYRIIVEGMTDTGIPVVKSSEFWVQDSKD